MVDKKQPNCTVIGCHNLERFGKVVEHLDCSHAMVWDWKTEESELSRTIAVPGTPRYCEICEREVPS